MCAECGRWQQMAEVDGQRLVQAEAHIQSLAASIAAMQTQLTTLERCQVEAEQAMAERLRTIESRMVLETVI